MEKQRGTAVAVIAALVVAVISLGVAFAAFSTTLNINGSATVEATKWDIHFNNAAYDSQGTNLAPSSAQTITPSTNANGTVTHATGEISIKGTDFTWSANLKSPGDYVEYTFYVVNAGDYNATLSGTFASIPQCHGTNDASSHACPITYSISDGEGHEYAQGITLNARSSKVVKVRATLNSDYGTNATTGANDGSTLYTEDQTVEFGQVVFTWTQDGNAQ